MYTLNVSETKDFVQNIAIDLRQPVMLWGQPGVGKSQLMAQLARQHNATLVDIRLSQYDSVDLRGIPVPQEGEGLTVWHAPATLPFKGNPRFDADAPVILLFLDEINSAAPAVAAVAYQLVNDRAVGEHELMDNVRVVAAGNREGDRGVTNRMPTPLANRFTHVEVGVDVDDFCAYAQKAQIPPVLIAFLQFRKPLLSTFDPAKPDKAFATPRTWEKAALYYDTAMPDNIKQAAMAGAVGDGQAAEFWGFVDVWQKIIPIKEILADPVKAQLPEEASMTYAVAVNISGHMDAKTIKPLYTYLKRLDPEFVVLAWQLAIRRDDALVTTPEFIEFSKQYRAIFR